MKHVLKTTTLSLGLILGLASCEKDDTEINKVEQITYEVPTTYAFDRNGQTTIDYSGQSSRLLMLEEIGNYVKTEANWPLNETKLLNMLDNTNNPFTNTELNTSGKKLSDKIAGSKDYFVNLGGGASSAEQASLQNTFKDILKNAAASSKNGSLVAEAGIAGLADGKRLVDGKGLELNQAFLKGMMGACFIDQISNHYLSTAVLDESTNKVDNTNKVLVAGTNYTKMEHLWDEAYGYIYGAGGGKYWDSYIGQVAADSDFSSVKTDISKAFIIGRAAILANDYTTRDQQVSIIREKLALVIAVRGVYYLQEGKALLTPDVAKAFHGLSEGYGFIQSLRFTQNPKTKQPYFSKEEVSTMLEDLQKGTNGFWDVDHMNVTLETMSQQIAAKFGFTVAQAKEVNTAQ